MRIVTLEEHFVVPPLVGRIPPEAVEARGWMSMNIVGAVKPGGLSNIGEKRLADMDEGHITVQVLAMAGPGADLMSPEEGPALARAYNEKLKEAVDAHPDRFAGFAHLPMSNPKAAADELQRAVEELGFRGAMINGITNGLFLDDPSFDPLLARAAKLDVPLYLHPNIPPKGVRDAYFAGLQPNDLPLILGWCWHSETALHIIRMAATGTFDRHPNLKMIIGHMGEGLPAMLARLDTMTMPVPSPHRSRPISQTILDQVWITTSGLWDLPSFTAAKMTFGVDRIMFSVDYPFGEIGVQRKFLEALPVSQADREKIAHGNADRLLKLV